MIPLFGILYVFWEIFKTKLIKSEDVDLIFADYEDKKLIIIIKFYKLFLQKNIILSKIKCNIITAFSNILSLFVTFPHDEEQYIEATFINYERYIAEGCCKKNPYFCIIKQNYPTSNIIYCSHANIP